MRLRTALFMPATLLVAFSVHAAPPQPAPPSLPAPSPAMPIPKAVSRVSPVYPASELCRKGGTTKVLLSLDAQGTVTRASVAASSGNRELDRAALTAIRQWKFEAAGSPSSGYVSVNFEPVGSASDCLHYASFGGLAGETPGYEAGSLEVRVHLMPPDADVLELVVLDSTGAALDRQTLAAEALPGVVKFHGLNTGEHVLSLRVDGAEIKRSTFTVLDDGSVMTPPPAPPEPLPGD